MKKKILFSVMVVASIVTEIIVSQNAHAKREAVRMDSLIGEIKLVSARTTSADGGSPPPQPTSTPIHNLMHVTQKLTAPGDPGRWLAELHKHDPNVVVPPIK